MISIEHPRPKFSFVYKDPSGISEVIQYDPHYAISIRGKTLHDVGYNTDRPNRPILFFDSVMISANSLEWPDPPFWVDIIGHMCDYDIDKARKITREEYYKAQHNSRCYFDMFIQP